MRRLTKALLVASLLPSVAFAQIEDKAQMLIEQMGARAKALNYKGYFTFERGSQSTSYFIAHRVDDGEQSQRLFFMDGPEREVIMDGHQVNCLHPGDKSKRPSQNDVQSLISLSQPKAGLWDFYEAELIGNARIADRDTNKVLLKPKDGHRYPFVFFIDSETGLMLKMLILDQQGFPLERFHYVTIDFDSVTKKDVSPTLGQSQLIEHAKADTDVAQKDTNTAKDWQLRWVPDGFREEPAVIDVPVGAQHQESHMYTDGLSAFTLFIEPVAQDAETQGTSKQLGSTSAVSHFVNVGDQVYIVTVIGEIPVTTARQIATSVRPKS